jgi:hypothetical protein
MLSPSKVREKSRRPIYVRALRSLRSSTKQQYESGAMSSEIHSIPRADVQSHFPNAVTQELVIAEIADSGPINPA